MLLNLKCKLEVFSFSFTGIVVFVDSTYKNSVSEIENRNLTTATICAQLISTAGCYLLQTKV